ncbi:AsnC family transcriptional regulator [Arthrobacter crystallopoietes BAB-32]|uniref:AsnC family transcriptional regulator n=1 Tax=Arthrobacter crystallopoietes BAB-32 TaxID=1246476 RepID=N1V2P1_9MICC|nr:Lrp/AsnC family transcriptional regulator [Arthrobacter crystallopoietes]EMY34259.1 AsnC family transcriptional regulator [Arthrobacter crystallopoietes BAB-32]
MVGSSEGRSRGRPAPKNVRGPDLDETDRLILRLLQADARMPNNALAARAGIAASTCHARIRSLQERGVIRGYHADVDPAAVGRGLQALIAIRLQAHARANLTRFEDYLAGLPAVEGIFFVTGDRDFLIHVAVPDSDTLRELVANNLSLRPEVAGTNTTVIFEYRRPVGPGS